MQSNVSLFVVTVVVYSILLLISRNRNEFGWKKEKQANLTETVVYHPECRLDLEVSSVLHVSYRDK